MFRYEGVPLHVGPTKRLPVDHDILEQNVLGTECLVETLEFYLVWQRGRSADVLKSHGNLVAIDHYGVVVGEFLSCCGWASDAHRRMACRADHLP